MTNPIHPQYPHGVLVDATGRDVRPATAAEERVLRQTGERRLANLALVHLVYRRADGREISQCDRDYPVLASPRTKEPVTLDGWYEHEDGTVGEYRSNQYGPQLVRTAASWTEVPSREQDLQDAIDAGAI